MGEKPILFSAPMVRAILDGRKTQTRRIIKPRRPAQFSIFNGEWSDSYVLDPGNAEWRERETRFALGDVLWVREAWRCNGWATDLATIFYRASVGQGYTAMCEQYPVAGKKPLRVTGTWRPSIHMPRWASRITLKVTGVKVERLQDISEEDAIAEGTETPETVRGLRVWHASHRAAYASLWQSINGPGSWDANPWVVAISFERIEGQEKADG